MLDFITILKGLNENEVQYIVVGGIAVNLHGIPRMTYDLDLLVNMADDNLKKLLNLMKKWDYKPKIPVDIMNFAKREKRDAWIKEKNMKAFCLINDGATVREIDIIIGSPVSYQEADANVKYLKLRNQEIPVAGVNDLITMKEKTGRLQDESDIRYLRKKDESS